MSNRWHAMLCVVGGSIVVDDDDDPSSSLNRSVGHVVRVSRASRYAVGSVHSKFNQLYAEITIIIII